MREKVEKAEKAEKARIKEKGNRKLAKLLGEDVSHVPRSSPTPPPPAPLQQPLQRQQSLSQSIETRTPPSASFASIPPPPPLIETPWYLSEDYQPEEIVFDDKGGVKAGTLRALVARLTPHGATGEFKSLGSIIMDLKADEYQILHFSRLSCSLSDLLRVVIYSLIFYWNASIYLCRRAWMLFNRPIGQSSSRPLSG